MELFISFTVYVMKKLSQIALEKCSLIITAINEHPFNQELASGSLTIEKNSDSTQNKILYLIEIFSRSIAVTASKTPLKFIEI